MLCVYDERGSYAQLTCAAQGRGACGWRSSGGATWSAGSRRGWAPAAASWVMRPRARPTCTLSSGAQGHASAARRLCIITMHFRAGSALCLPAQCSSAMRCQMYMRVWLRSLAMIISVWTSGCHRRRVAVLRFSQEQTHLLHASPQNEYYSAATALQTCIDGTPQPPAGAHSAMNSNRTDGTP